MRSRITTRSLHRSLAGFALARLLAPLGILLGAAPAQAATCPGSSYSIPGVEVGASFTWAPECSDGVAQLWNGVVYDQSCDGRAGYVWFKVYDRQASGQYVLLETSQKYKVTNGCGSNASFSTWRPRSPGSTGWKLTVTLQACNGFSCSTARDNNLFG